MRKLFLNVFIFFWAIFMLTNSGGIGFSEGEYQYEVAEQIINHGQLGFDEPKAGIFEVAPNGKTYNSHEIGNTLFMLPTAFVNVNLENLLVNHLSPESISKIKQFIVSFQPSLYSAITATTFLAILLIGFSQNLIPAFLATLGLAFTTYFWTYSRSLYDGVLCSTLLTVSFFYLLKYKKTQNFTPLIFSFVCLGFGFITRFPMILAIAPSVVYAAIITRKQNYLKLFVIVSLTLVPFFIWQAFYNHLRTGFFYLPAVLLPKYAGTNLGESNDAAFIVKLIGLLISPGKGLLVYAPLLVLSIFFFKKFSRDFRKESIYILSVVVLWLLLHSNLGSNWYGSVGWGPRHLIVILPIAFIPFATNIKLAFKHLFLRIVTILLTIWGLILALSSLVSDFQFRVLYARQNGIESDEIFVWGFWHSQSIDMLRAAAENIHRIFTHSPAIDLHGFSSEANEYASSTINIWANSLIHAGIPWYVVAILVFPLIFAIYKSLVIINCSVQQENQVEKNYLRSLKERAND